MTNQNYKSFISPFLDFQDLKNEEQISYIRRNEDTVTQVLSYRASLYQEKVF